MIVDRQTLAALPIAMHPWMDPARESRLWPHGDDEFARLLEALDCGQA